MIRVKLQNVSKEFEMEHEKLSSLKEKFVTSIKRMDKKSEKIWAIKNVSFKAKEGECIGVIGENASGKTTLLKVIGNILKPTEGKVEVNGRIATLLTLGLGFNPELTARENVYLYSSIMGLRKEEIESKYDNIVNFSELDEFMDVKLKSFSDGMKVRLGFATAINVDADILLVDEVLAVGDGAFQRKCLRKFEELKRRGKTIILVSHGLNTIKRYSDKVIFLKNGEMEEYGNPEEVIESYESYLKNKELKLYNSVVLEEIKNLGIKDVKVYKNGDECWVFKTGEPFKARVKFNVKKKPSDFFISFTNGTETRFYNKKMKKNTIEFNVNSLPLNEGKYRLFVGYGNNFRSKNFEFLVKEGKVVQNTRMFSEDFSFNGEVYAFGKDCEKIFNNFNKGKTLIVLSNIDEAAKGSEIGVIFNNRKISFKGKSEEVIEKHKERFCKEMIEKYGKELGLNERKNG